MALLMYCNHTKLQYEYKRHGCREAATLQSVEDPEFTKWKGHNAEVGHWYKLLFEAVEMFRTRVTSKDVFFTGLGARLLFENYAPWFKCPVDDSRVPQSHLVFETERARHQDDGIGRLH